MVDERSLDVFGAFVFLCAGALLLAIPIVDAVVLGPNESAMAAPTSAVGTLGVAALVAGAGVVSHSERLLSIAYAPTAVGETIWNEVILFGATVLATLIASAVTLAYLEQLSPVPSLVSPLLVGVVMGISLAAIYWRRRGRIEYPGWLQADSWGVSDYTALFFVVAMLPLVYPGIADPTGVLDSTFAVAYGTAAVALRKAGAFVPESDDEFNNRGSERSR